jgi:hypothetical protein
MKATLRLKLHTDPATDAALHETLRQSTACFNAICRYGWNHNERNGTRLHQSTYNSLRQLYDTLPSQLVVSSRMKAAEALKSVAERKKQGKKISCPQSELCPIRYDARSYWVKLAEGIASLATVCACRFASRHSHPLLPGIPMLRHQLTPKKAALALGGALLLGVLIVLGFHMQQNRNADSQETKMAWQRDREMGVPDTGLGENATPEEREQARTRVLDDKMTQERTSSAPAGSQ